MCAQTTGMDEQQLYGGTQSALSTTLLLWKPALRPHVVLSRATTMDIPAVAMGGVTPLPTPPG
jgi:hypothetical protein